MTGFSPKRLLEAAHETRAQISGLKESHDPAFDWYPYDSLASVPRMVELWKIGMAPDLAELALQHGVLDVGCGDGELSFLFEKLGCRVAAIDYFTTNHNGMRGIRTLKELLGSSIEIIEANIDEHFPDLEQQYGLALCMGVVYHLRNPFLAVGHTARNASYCFLSTRIANHFPDGKEMPVDQPIAYLVDTYELNSDESNYWIFSRAGLERMLRRSDWEVLSTASAGNTNYSDPVREQYDERIFCLMRSHYGMAHLDLLEGWHQPERNGWRWTAQTFSFRHRLTDRSPAGVFQMQLYLPPEMLTIVGAPTLSGTLNGEKLPAMDLRKSGNHTYELKLRPSERSLTFTFQLDRCLPPGADDPRELGIIVGSIEVH